MVRNIPAVSRLDTALLKMFLSLPVYFFSIFEEVILTLAEKRFMFFKVVPMVRMYY